MTRARTGIAVGLGTPHGVEANATRRVISMFISFLYCSDLCEGLAELSVITQRCE